MRWAFRGIVLADDSVQRGVVFDFDGVSVSTDELQYRAWVSVHARRSDRLNVWYPT
jgi:hypothetical protein